MSEQDAWRANLANYTAQLSQTMANRQAVLNGEVIAKQYCDVCGRNNVKVYAFKCVGDEATHMYCAPCSKTVVNALKRFYEQFFISREES